MYVPMPTTDIALLLRHGMLHKKSVASVTKMLDHYRTYHIYKIWYNSSNNTCGGNSDSSYD